MRKSVRAWWKEGEPWYAAVAVANLVLGASSILIPLAVKLLLGRSVDSLGVLSSFASLVGVAGSLVWGRLSDAAHRRKPFIILSYAVPGACLVAMAFAGTFEALVLLNMLLNLFWVANGSVTVLLAIESHDAREWETKLSHLNQAGTLGWVFGLLLGSAALALGGAWLGEVRALRATFALIGVGGLAAAALAAWWVPEARPRTSAVAAPSPFVALGNALADLVLLGPVRRLDARRIGYRLRQWASDLAPGAKAFYVATLVTYLGMGLFGIPLPLLLAERFQFSSSVVFLLFALQNAAIVVTYPWASRRIQKTGNLRVQKGALLLRLALFAVAAVALAWVRAPIPMPILIVAFVVYGVTWATFQLSATAITSKLAKPEARGRALGLYSGIAGTGWILAGVGSGYLARWAGYHVTFGAAAACLATAILILRRVPEPEAAEDQARGEPAA